MFQYIFACRTGFIHEPFSRGGKLSQIADCIPAFNNVFNPRVILLRPTFPCGSYLT